MKKIALCLSLGTLLLSGVGCGDMNADQTEGQGLYQRDQTGYGVDQGGTGLAGANYGQQGRQGTHQNRVTGQQGAVGPGQQAGRGGLGVGEGPGVAGQGAGQRGGLGLGAGRQAGQGAAGPARGHGITGQRAGQGATQGFRQGITGDDRPGMVDENGLLNGRLGGFNRQTNQGPGHLNRGIHGQDQMHGGTTIPRNQPRQSQGQQVQDGTAYFDTDDGRMARKIENRLEDIEGVEDVDVIVHEDNVIVGVDADGNNKQLERRVRAATTKVNDDMQVHVVTQRDGVERIHGMGNRLRGGEPFEEIGATFNAMLDDLGDAIQRPFERTR